MARNDIRVCRERYGVVYASGQWARRCMYWGMGRGAWKGLGLCFKRGWVGGVKRGRSRDGKDEEMRKVRRRAGLLRSSDGGL